jgi:hypothetical protein
MNSNPSTATHRIGADLEALRAVVSASPIVVHATLTPQFAAWQLARRSTDVDAVVLAWLRAHAAAGPQRGRRH